MIPGGRTSGEIREHKSEPASHTTMSSASSLEERHPKTPADQGAKRAGRRARIHEKLVGLHTRSRRVISEHRHPRKLRDRAVSHRRPRGLDLTDFFLAAVQLSLCSFL